MLDINRIEGYFLSLSSASKTERESYLPFLEGAYEDILGRLEGKSLSSSQEKALERLAGAVSLYRLCLANGSKGEMESVKIGELSLKSSLDKELKMARELAREHYRACRDIFEGDIGLFGRAIIYD